MKFPSEPGKAREALEIAGKTAMEFVLQNDFDPHRVILMLPNGEVHEDFPDLGAAERFLKRTKNRGYYTFGDVDRPNYFGRWPKVLQTALTPLPCVRGPVHAIASLSQSSPMVRLSVYIGPVVVVKQDPPSLMIPTASFSPTGPGFREVHISAEFVMMYNLKTLGSLRVQDAVTMIRSAIRKGDLTKHLTY